MKILQHRALIRRSLPLRCILHCVLALSIVLSSSGTLAATQKQPPPTRTIPATAVKQKSFLPFSKTISKTTNRSRVFHKKPISRTQLPPIKKLLGTVSKIPQSNSPRTKSNKSFVTPAFAPVLRLYINLAKNAYEAGTGVIIRRQKDRVCHPSFPQCPESYTYDMLTAYHVVRDFDPNRPTNFLFSDRQTAPIIPVADFKIHKLPCVENPSSLSPKTIQNIRAAAEGVCRTDIAWLRFTTSTFFTVVTLPEKLTNISHNKSCAGGFPSGTSVFSLKCEPVQTKIYDGDSVLKQFRSDFKAYFNEVEGGIAYTPQLDVPNGMSGGPLYNEHNELMGIISSASYLESGKTKSILHTNSIPISNICTLWKTLCVEPRRQ